MTPTQKNELQAVIVARLAKLDQEIEFLIEQTKPVEPDCSLCDLVREELMDEQQIRLKILDEYRSESTRLKYTLGRIDDEEFGLCLVCEDEIPFERMILVPASSICVECANERR